MKHKVRDYIYVQYQQKTETTSMFKKCKMSHKTRSSVQWT